MTVHLERALLLVEQGRPELAEGELRQALAAAPDDAMAHALLALCLAARADLAAATTEAEAAVGLAPDLPFAHYALASVLADRDRLAEAEVAIGEAIRLDPDDAGCFALLAQIQLNRRRPREALAAAEEGLRRDPEHTGCTNLRAVALVQLGRKEEAGATIDAALARDPEDALTHANQGWTLLHRRQADRAVEHFREALRLDPQLDWARQGLVEALKARYPVYGLLLRYFLWMSRLSGKAQLGVILGGVLGYRLLRGVAQSNPALAPFITPLLIVYGIFVFLTWTADALFNLVLRLNRLGRHALSGEQVMASNLVGGCLLLALVAGAVGAITGHPTALLAALLFAVLVLPVAGAFRVPAGWPRLVMAAAAGLVALVGVLGLGLSLVAGQAVTTGIVGLAILGAILSSWLTNLLLFVRPRR